MITSESIKTIAPALLKAQRKMGAALKDAKNPFFKSNYADLGSVMEVMKQPLNDEGILITQSVLSRDGNHYVETRLLHESGEFISSGEMMLVLVKNDMQQLGSSITYAKRYQLQALGFVPSEDDDGNIASGKTHNPVQAKTPTKPALVTTQQVTNTPHSTTVVNIEQPKVETFTNEDKNKILAKAESAPAKTGFGGFKASKPKTDLGF